MTDNKKVLVLYRRMAGYFYECLKTFAHKENAEIIIVCDPVSPDAPFHFEQVRGIRLYSSGQVSVTDLVKEFEPDVIICSGWSNRNYLTVCKTQKEKGKVTVLAMDNPWKQTIQQRVKAFLGRPLIQKTFSHIWIPGFAQYYFSRKLGFEPARILKGLYCSDPYFSTISADPNSNVLLFVGRLVDYKRPDLLMEIFQQLVQLPQFIHWKLRIIGNGPMIEQLRLKAGPAVELIEFSNRETLSEYFRTSAALCLPSIGEHWGVVVHEALSAGLPVLLSDTVGAGEDLLVDSYNGYLFQTHSKSSLQQSMRKFMELPEGKRLQLCQSSKDISKKINQEVWCATLAGLF